jgi:hypothetical protein
MIASTPERLSPFGSIADFRRVTDPSAFTPVPEGWLVGVTDVVRSTEAIAAGRAKAVNIAGAAAISAVMNALQTRDLAFAFMGDGCAFTIPPADAPVAREALRRTAGFARDDLGLTLRTALVPVDALRADGHDVRVALFRPTEHVAYAMFDGGGVAAAEAAMKRGEHAIGPAPSGERPDLTGLSCRWLPLEARHGSMVSLVALPGEDRAAFRAAVAEILALLGEPAETHPVPPEGAASAFLSPGLRLEALTSRRSGPVWRRLLAVAAHNVFGWTLFRTGVKLGAFDPVIYRRFTSENADCRKFGDGLLLTLDCDAALDARLVNCLDGHVRTGALRYGLHRQRSALMTCIVPTYADHGHVHFIDGAEGGYTAAAAHLKHRAPEASPPSRPGGHR